MGAAARPSALVATNVSNKASADFAKLALVARLADAEIERLKSALDRGPHGFAQQQTARAAACDFGIKIVGEKEAAGGRAGRRRSPRAAPSMSACSSSDGRPSARPWIARRPRKSRVAWLSYGFAGPPDRARSRFASRKVSRMRAASASLRAATCATGPIDFELLGQFPELLCSSFEACASRQAANVRGSSDL